MGTRGRSQVSWWARVLWLVVIVSVAASVLLCIHAFKRLPNPAHNTLAIGEDARLAELEVELYPAIELDWMTRADVLELRREAVYRYPDLIVGDYQPSEAVFGQIEDGLPWWGFKGQYFGSGSRSIEGPAEESRYIMNPYLLVAANTWLSGAMWGGTRITWDDLDSPDFPYYCLPESLWWWPKEAHAEVVYPVSRCLDRKNQWVIEPQSASSAIFDLVAYNARDMNLNYMYVAYADSLNIFKDDPPGKPYTIPQYIHRGQSCGYPGGCNNMSPSCPEIQHISIEALPAQTTIWLWERKPLSVERPPDMTFVIRFE
jgi:hypothetical protein